MNLDRLKGLNGMELLEKVIRGEISHPSMATTIPMKLVKAEKGFAEFEARADKNHLNPMGTIHGGFTATVLDSVTGCAVHTIWTVVSSVSGKLCFFGLKMMHSGAPASP